MALVTGDRVGPYEIVATLGSGGMGEVYRARDTKLGRDVALKILPPTSGADPERLARFEREARLLAALNHPNIATLYGLEDSGTTTALVMEVVDGDTLAECLAKALPIPQVVALAKQIVDALEAAHERGIVHRDLKPANVKITPAGAVKVLDFGLAKLEIGAASGDQFLATPELSRSPTVLSSGTRAGVILGTAPYMSPEQARGLPVDKRTDIWAFGCVLYEMLTGRRAFEGETLADVLVAILNRDPDWTMLPIETAPSLRRLLRRCLEKEPRRRLRDVADARLDLEELTDPGATDSGARTAIATAHDLVFQRITDFVGLTESPVVSPDGKMVAFVALVAGRRQIWIRLTAGGTLLQLTRDDSDHLFPRWAPDSNTLIYYTPSTSKREEGTIFEIGALGGWPRPVTTAVGAADISHDGGRLAFPRAAGDRLMLATVARDGSKIEQVAQLPAALYSSIRWSPDDKWIAYQRSNFSAGFEVALDMVSVRDGERREITRDSALKGFSWLPDNSGFVYSSSRGSTMLYPPVCNLRTIGRDGSGDRALTFGDDSYIDPDAHATGSLLACRVRMRSDIWRFPVAGSPAENTREARRITRQTGQVQTPSVSPDGAHIVYISDNGGHANLWVTGTDGSEARQITFETEPAVSVGVPVWSPRGDVIAFVMNRGGQGGLWAVRPDGTALRHIVRGWAPCWSSDGRWLYFWRLGEECKRVEKIPIDGGDPIVVREDASGIVLPAVSADGRTLYFVRPAGSEPDSDRSRDLRPALGTWWWGSVAEFCRASPEDGPHEVMARVIGERIPGAPGPLVGHAVLSPDGQWLATSLIDGATTNLWALPTAGGAMKLLTDFGDRPTLISRSISWSADSQYLYAALAESQTNIVLIKGLTV
jgi:Tol biopolymer transport system component/aminoglycoside phosphotransferase (APT) family kinase protein